MIGSKIKQLRVNKQLTQEELAEKLHVTRNAVSKWETDKGLPNIQSLKDIARVFSISLDDLLSEEDIVLMTIENKRTVEINRNLIISILLFFSFMLIGMVIPSFLFRIDPTSGIAVFVILLPVSYILLAVFSVLSRVKWPYVVISTVIALTPIYIYFDTVLTGVVLGYWGIIYYILYLGTYFLFLKVIDVFSGIYQHQKLTKMSLILALVLSIIYVIHTVYKAVELYQCEVCSAPWYTVVITHSIFYGIPIAMAYTLYFYFKSKRTRASN